MSQFYYHAVSKLPILFSDFLFKIDEYVSTQITEIRIRVGRCIMLCGFDTDYCVGNNGDLHKTQTDNCIVVTQTQLQECFLHLCGHSVYTFEESIKNGFITLNGGHRVGIAGKICEQNGCAVSIKDITSINIRVARCINTNIDTMLEDILNMDYPRILIVGQPCCGKTTILRTISQIVSNQGKNVSVIDEREEIWPQQAGCFATAPPLRCDVLSGFKKGTGALMAIRSLAPNVIICDEIGSSEDTYALEQSLHTGVGIIATAHASSATDAYCRPQLETLLKKKVFDYIVVMQGREKIGEIKEVVKIADFY